MADDNKILSASGGSSFDDTLESASKSIERVVKAADTAEKKLGELEDRFNSTADKFKEASGSIKSDIAALRSSMNSKNSFEMLNELKDTNSELKEMEERLRKINKFGSSKNKKSSGSSGDSKNKKINLSTASDLASLAGDVLGVSKTAGKASKSLVTLGGKLGVAAGAAGLLVTSLSVLADISSKSHANILKTSTALRQMGMDVGDVGERSIEASKSINDLKNRISNGLNDIGGVFADFINGVAIKVDGLLDALGIGNEGEVSGKIASVLASISADSKQSGFSQNSAAVLASGTYSVAQILENKGLAGGKQASEIANDLAEAWLTGSDAAKEYGIVVNDNVLTGYLAAQGIDIANVEITDAMKQYYRYQLMMDQATASNSSEMQDLIKDWTQLGFMIDKTKNKLFSFDEVITLSAADPTIPEVFGDIINPGLDDDSIGGDEPSNNKNNNNNNGNNGSEDVNKASDGMKEASDGMKQASDSMKDASDGMQEASDGMQEASDGMKEASNGMQQASNNMSSSFGLFDGSILKLDGLFNNDANNLLARLEAILGSSNTNYDVLFNINAGFGNNVSLFGNHTLSFGSSVGAFGSYISGFMSGISSLGSIIGSIPSVVSSAAQSVSSMFAGMVNTGKATLSQYIASGKNLLLGVANNASNGLLSLGGKLARNISTAAMVGLNKLNVATNGGIANLDLRSRQWLSNISSAGSSILSNISSAGNNVLGRIGSTGNKVLGSISSAGNNVLGGISSAGQSMINNIISVGNSVLAAIASAGGGGSRRVSSGFSSRSSRSSGSSRSNNKSSNKSGGIFSPLDIVLETGDLISSLKDRETGKYDFSAGSIASGVLNMLVSTFTSPIKQGISGATVGANESFDYIYNKTGSKLLAAGAGLLGGAGLGLWNLFSYPWLETAGDVANTAEVVSDALSWLSGGAYNTPDWLSSASVSIDRYLNYRQSGHGMADISEVALKNPGTFNVEDYFGNLAQILYFDTYMHSRYGTDYGAYSGAYSSFADGGIGTREIHNASLFEGNKKEAVIPLESTEGIRYLSNALHEAGLPDTGNIGGDIIINLTLSGVNMANNEAEWERVGKKIAEVIDIQRQRRGELSYGSSF